MNKHKTPSRMSPLRRAVLGVLAVISAFVLTACGAVITTTMTVTNDGSGSRVMVLTLDGDDASRLTGGTAAVDASVRKRLPPELEYAGTQGTSDGGMTVTLSLSFSSPDEYKEKALALLNKSRDSAANLDFSVTDSLLLSGIQISESFTSYSLLEWMFNGLVADGVVSESDSSNMYEIGDTVLNFGGTSANQRSSTYNYASVVDNGFTSVTMTTDISDTSNITRKITYRAPAHYGSNKAVYEQFFTQSTPSGANVTTVSEGLWEMNFSGDADSISRSTDQATGGTGSKFSVDTSPSPEDPATLTKRVTNIASCENICAAESGETIIDTMTAGAEYAPEQLDIDTTAGERVRFDFSPAIKSAEASFNFGIFGGVTSTVKFVVPNESVELVGDGFARLFQPPKGVGSITSDKGSTDTEFTIVIAGDDATAVNSAYSKWASGGAISAVEGPDSSLFAADVTYDINPALNSIIRGHPVTGGTTTSVRLPFGQTISSAGGEQGVQNGITGTTIMYEGSDSSRSFQSSGPTFAGLLLIAGGTLALVAAAFLLVRFRRQINTAVTESRARFEEARALFREDMEPSGLEILTISAGLPLSREPLFAMPASTSQRTDRSMLDWQRATRARIPAVALSNLARPSRTHPEIGRASLVALPTSKPTPRNHPSLFDRDSVGTSRSLNTTN